MTIAALLPAIGCGGADTLTFEGTDQDQVAATVNAMTAAIAAGEGALACELMTARAQRIMLAAGRQAATGPEPVDDCAAAVPSAEAAGYDPGDFRIKVGDVRVSGDRAVARCDLDGEFALVRDDAGWRVDVPYCNH